MSKNKNEVSRDFNMFNSCETLHIHVDKNLVQQLKEGVNASPPKPSPKLPGGIEIDLSGLKRLLNISFREKKSTNEGNLVIRLRKKP